MDIIKEIINLDVGTVLKNVNLKDYTTYKVGGNALAVVMPKDVEGLIILLKYLRENNIKHKILGKGSNLIFGENGYDGILIKLDSLDQLEIKGNEIKVGAGYSLVKLATRLSRMGYTGLEFATGIPGTVGGAVYMNAGAYKSDMGYIVKSVKVLTPRYSVVEMTNYDMDFHYRTSFLQKNPDYICLETTIILKKGNPDEIQLLIDDRKKRRLESQPLEYPSAGSVFRNPEGDFAGRLIEEIGYKGYKIGGAEVSNKHANFIINVGDASGDDVKKLILEIQSKVKEKYDIELKVEQEFVE
jgi:UDP-N-acetylenolpyruvoylglucosamine reductase